MTDHDDTEDLDGELPADAPEETPAEAIERLSTELTGIARRASGGSVEFARGSVVFAVQTGARLEFRLRTEIAAAGLRTAATSRSPRGADWISLDTSAGDAFTVDRVVAWFEMAWRVAGESAGQPRPH